jgi:hypothetical protein
VGLGETQRKAVKHPQGKNIRVVAFGVDARGHCAQDSLLTEFSI